LAKTVFSSVQDVPPFFVHTERSRICLVLLCSDSLPATKLKKSHRASVFIREPCLFYQACFGDDLEILVSRETPPLRGLDGSHNDSKERGYIEQKMNTQKHTQALRLNLLDMSKLSQRAVDYAIKGYKLGSPEFCWHVRHGDSDLRELRHKITDRCREFFMGLDFDSEVLMDQLAVDAEMRFHFSALQICDALHTTCTAAAEIAQNTMLLLENSCASGCVVLERLCHQVNRLMSLCVVALFKKEIRHAETVLQNQEVGRLFEQVYHKLRDDTNQRTDVAADLEFAITKSLGQIARHTQEIAEAIVYWLSGTKYTLESDVSARV